MCVCVSTTTAVPTHICLRHVYIHVYPCTFTLIHVHIHVCIQGREQRENEKRAGDPQRKICSFCNTNIYMTPTQYTKVYAYIT